jgi:hypothetical protein
MTRAHPAHPRALFLLFLFLSVTLALSLFLPCSSAAIRDVQFLVRRVRRSVLDPKGVPTIKIPTISR